MSEAAIQDDMTILTKKIKLIIFKLYHAFFKGKLEVHHKDGIYTLIIGIPSNMRPSSYNFEGTEDQFLKFIEEEFKYNNKLWINYTEARIVYDD